MHLKDLLYNADVILLSLPIQLPARLAVGPNRRLVQNNHSFIRGIGIASRYTLLTMTALLGLPATVWCVVKIIFSSLLNLATCRSLQCVNRWATFNVKQFRQGITNFQKICEGSK